MQAVDVLTDQLGEVPVCALQLVRLSTRRWEASEIAVTQQGGLNPPRVYFTKLLHVPVVLSPLQVIHYCELLLLMKSWVTAKEMAEVRVLPHLWVVLLTSHHT
jgi:hypothetical protein